MHTCIVDSNMSEVINLNKTRKAKARTQKEKKASQNRLLFGRTKAEKKTDLLNAKRAEKNIDGHKLSTEEDS